MGCITRLCLALWHLPLSSATHHHAALPPRPLSGGAIHSMALRLASLPCAALPSTPLHFTAQALWNCHRTIHHCNAHVSLYCTAAHSTALHLTAFHWTVHHCTNLQSAPGATYHCPPLHINGLNHAPHPTALPYTPSPLHCLPHCPLWPACPPHLLVLAVICRLSPRSALGETSKVAMKMAWKTHVG